jgi:drug/metabolite transporter (DMT)-like permease
MAVSDNLRGSALMMAAMIAFTVNDACMKAVAVDLPIFEAIALRGFLTLVALGAIGLAMGALKPMVPKGDRLWIGLRTLGEVGGTFTFLTALKHMPLANLSAIMQSLPLAVTLAGAVLLREPVGWRRMTAIVIGFCGVLLIVRPGTEGFDRWSVAGLVSVAFVVLRDLATRRLSRSVPSVTVAFYAALSVALGAALALPFTEVVAVSAHHVVQIFAAAAFLIVGYLTVVMAMRVGDIAVVAPFRYASLVAAILLGWGAFGQFPDKWTLAGAAIVVATGIYTFYRERRLGRRVVRLDATALTAD